MKRTILGILSLIYITVASGVVINIHYCMGRIAEVGYAYNASDKCDKCGMKNKEGCCHSEFKIVKLNDDQQQVKTDISSGQSLVALLHYTSSILQPLQGFEKMEAIHHYTPPDVHQVPLYLSNTVFRI